MGISSVLVVCVEDVGSAVVEGIGEPGKSSSETSMPS